MTSTEEAERNETTTDETSTNEIATDETATEDTDERNETMCGKEEFEYYDFEDHEGNILYFAPC